MKFTCLIGCIVVFLSAPLAYSHEFWISPERYNVREGESIVAAIRVGIKFSGSDLSYFPGRFERFDIVTADGIQRVQGVLGDRPALDQTSVVTGINILVHETKDSNLKYKSLEQFTNFVTHKDFSGVLARHAARGLPDFGFSESYRRFAKSLVTVGDTKGADREVGLRTEIVALENPYAGEARSQLPILVLYEGAPRVNAQIEVFAKDDQGDVEVAFYHTNDQGQAVIDVHAGREYLVDAVVMRDTGNDDIEKGPVWESLWASLTFKLP